MAESRNPHRLDCRAVVISNSTSGGVRYLRSMATGEKIVFGVVGVGCWFFMGFRGFSGATMEHMVFSSLVARALGGGASDNCPEQISNYFNGLDPIQLLGSFLYTNQCVR
jgi:hypothetical protein